jgi:hypothetical protein
MYIAMQAGRQRGSRWGGANVQPSLSRTSPPSISIPDGTDLSHILQSDFEPFPSKSLRTSGALHPSLPTI